MIPAGKYVARAQNAEFGVSGQKGTDQVVVTFEIREGEHKGDVIDWYGFFTEKTGQRTVESLRHCGCTFPGDDVFDTAGLGTKDVQIVVEHEEYKGQTKARVQWVNELGAGLKPMETAAKASFKDRMKATLLLVKQQRPALTEAEAEDDIPWGKEKAS